MARALELIEGAQPELGSESGRRRPVVALVHAGTVRRAVAHRRLADASFDVVAVTVDRRIVDRVLAIRPDAVLVDLDGATIDPVRLCRALNDALDARIVVVASEPLTDALVVDALDAGAADVVIGASPAVVDARIRVALRAQPRRPAEPSALEVGDVLIDLQAHEVRIGGEPVRCPPVQYELLVALARRPGAAIDGSELLRTVWGAAPGDVHPRRLRIAVSVLRGILGIGPARPRVESVSRVGYRLVIPG